MIVTMIPYCPSEQGANLGFAYNELMRRLGDDDWACFVDHDACFTTSDWYRQLETITAALAEPCVLTAKTNRVGSRWQLVEGVDPNNHSIAYHRRVGHLLRDQYGTALRDVTKLPLMSGVVIFLSTATWRVLGGFLDGFFGVDNAIHRAARDRGYKVYLMEGVYVYNWYRADGKMAATVAPSAKAAAGVKKTVAPCPSDSPRLMAHRAEPQPCEDGPSKRTPALRIEASAHRLLRLVPGPVGSTKTQADIGLNSADPAAERVHTITVDDFEKRAPQLANGSLDCVDCGQALAQLRDPAEFLQQARDWLAEGGSLVASVPNVADHRTIAGLLEGRWNAAGFPGAAAKAVRFFTKREIEKLLYRAGFAVEELRAIAGEGYEEWQAAGRPGEVRLGRLHIGGLRPEDAEQFYVAEYNVRATPSAQPEHGLTSIIIVTHNQLQYTRQCVNSILQLTDEPYELVFVDNGSTDGTVQYLQSLEGVTVIANDDNCGFPTAANQGLRASRGVQVLLLNNDTVVTTGWLDRLLAALHRDDRIGLVGPCSNQVSGPQQVPVAYTDLTSLDGFAWEWSKAHHENLLDTDRLVGFCLLIRREVIDKIGLLDERFGIGNFEDDDYCLRARKAGYRAAIARDAFIHHFGGRTFVGAGVDFEELMRKNERLLREKWQSNSEDRAGQEPPGERRTAPTPAKLSARVGERGGLILVHDSIRLSLSMIVRDNEPTLDACLASIKPWVDEIVVVDTGSKDKTPQIAAKHGARVYHFPWCDDFAVARNESLRHARGEWVFWMDSDDTIDVNSGRKLRELACREADSQTLGYVMQVHCPGGSDGQPDVTVVDHVKMFRNRPDLRFECRIHEQILPAIRRAGGDVTWTDIFVTHSGADHSPEGLKRKQERDLRLLKLELEDRPDHPFALFNLGMTYADTGDYQKGADALVKSLKVSGPDESHVRKAYALLVNCYSQLDRHDDAQRVCREGRRQFPKDPELAFRDGMLAHHFGRLEDAVEAYKLALANDDDRHFSSVDRGIAGFKARYNLAVVYVDMGDLDAAIGEWRKVVQEAPYYREGWRGLGETLLRKGAFKDAEAVAQKLDREPQLHAEATLVRAKLSKGRGDLAAAKRGFEQAVREVCDDPEPLRNLCQFLFEHGEPHEAQKALQELTRRDPEDASAFHNLGTVCLRLGRSDDAIHAYRQSLDLRPGAAATFAHLGLALRSAGRLDEAIDCWHKAIELDVNDPIAGNALREHASVLTTKENPSSHNP